MPDFQLCNLLAHPGGLIDESCLHMKNIVKSNSYFCTVCEYCAEIHMLRNIFCICFTTVRIPHSISSANNWDIQCGQVQFSADAGYGEHGNKQGIGNSRSGQKMGQVKVSPSQGGNNGELSWRDIVPNIGITDHEAALLRPGNSTTAPVRETRVVSVYEPGLHYL